MRLFIAVPMPSEVKDYLFKLENKIKGTNLAKVAWTPKKNLHLTLKFLGEADVEKVKERLDGIKLKKFDAKLTKIGVFPSESLLRVIFVGCEPGKKFLELEHAIDAETMDLSRADHQFVSHVTLGRVRSIKDKKKFLEFMNALEIEEMKFVVDTFSLFQSDLKKEGAQYKVLETYKLS